MRARSHDRLTHDGHRAMVPWAVDSVWKADDDFDQDLVHHQHRTETKHTPRLLKYIPYSTWAYHVSRTKFHVRTLHPHRRTTCCRCTP